jgi:hypothetical protein
VTATGEELWTYGGVRVSGRGQRVYAWIDHAGEELWFPKTGTHAAVGSQYRVTVKAVRRRHLDHRHPAIRWPSLRQRPAPTALGAALGSHHAPGV